MQSEITVKEARCQQEGPSCQSWTKTSADHKQKERNPIQNHIKKDKIPRFVKGPLGMGQKMQIPYHILYIVAEWR